MINPEDSSLNKSTKMRDRPANEAIERPEGEEHDKAEQVANKAAVKGQNRMKNNEDARGPFSNFGQ